nr:unnamed protein product [Callosobruchus analis]
MYTSVQTGHPRPPRRKRNASDSMDLSNAVLQSVNEHFKRPPVKEDHIDIFGKNVAMVLRELPKQQRLLAEKIINDTLFQAEMDTLTLPSCAASTVYFRRTRPNRLPVLQRTSRSSFFVRYQLRPLQHHCYKASQYISIQLNIL